MNTDNGEKKSLPRLKSQISPKIKLSNAVGVGQLRINVHTSWEETLPQLCSIFSLSADVEN